ncbi:MAG: hypothetical protein ABI377_04230 [Devosia sp.]
MYTGVQWTGSLTANQTQRWFTFNWNPASHIVWYMMPTSPNPGAAELNWSTALQRTDGSHVTYWITVTNLTNAPITFEGRYAVLN